MFRHAREIRFLPPPLSSTPGQAGQRKRENFTSVMRDTRGTKAETTSSPFPAPLTNILSADTLVLRRYPRKGFSKVALTSIGNNNLAAPTFPERIYLGRSRKRDIWATGWLNEEISFRVSTPLPLPFSIIRSSFNLC
jgi:hypothetical protein